MVALARGMAARLKVLLLDEPCLGLAEAVARRVYDWLAEMTKTDMTIVLVEENPVHALLVADRAVRMYKGLVERRRSGLKAGDGVSEFLNLLAAGLTSGAIYGIFGACLAVWFRVCNVLNLAAGDFAMFGAIGTAWLAQNAGLPFIAGIVVDAGGRRPGRLALRPGRAAPRVRPGQGRARHRERVLLHLRALAGARGRGSRPCSARTCTARRWIWPGPCAGHARLPRAAGRALSSPWPS